MTKIISNIHRKKVEKDLKDYPYMLMALESQEYTVNEYEYQIKVAVIKQVLEILDSTSRWIIEEWYFRNMLTQKQIEENLNISKEQYYKLRNEALRKFSIALGYRKKEEKNKKK